jgi:uncharacterized protein YggU (UPF0235/DUF167 family)
LNGSLINFPWKSVEAGLVLAVRATPKGGRDAIDGIQRLADGNTVLKVRVRVAPNDGRANEALIHLIVYAAGVAPSAVSLVRGASARNKIFRLSGDPRILALAFEKTLQVNAGNTR